MAVHCSHRMGNFLMPACPCDGPAMRDGSSGGTEVTDVPIPSRSLPAQAALRLFASQLESSRGPEKQP